MSGASPAQRTRGVAALHPRRAWPWALGALAWAAFIYWASSRPNPFPFVPQAFWSFDKLLHAGAYAVLGALVRLAVAGAARALRPGAALALAVAITACYGATDEWHQAHVPNRSADPLDWAADLAGGLAGAVLVSAFLRRRADGA